MKCINGDTSISDSPSIDRDLLFPLNTKNRKETRTKIIKKHAAKSIHLKGAFEICLSFSGGTSPSDSPSIDLSIVLCLLNERNKDKNYQKTCDKIDPFEGRMQNFSSLLKGHIPLRRPLSRSTGYSQLKTYRNGDIYSQRS